MAHLVVRKNDENKHKKVKSFKNLRLILYTSLLLNIVLTTLLYRLKG